MLAGEIRIYALSIHADYACRHSGACCTSGWPIPVERRTLERLSKRIATGRITVPDARHELRDGVRREKSDDFRPAPGSVMTPSDAGHAFIRVAEAPDEPPVVAAVRADGACAFYERDSGLCAIHRQAGPSLLPVACRQFPRVSLLDARGLFVTLSHYCPTAAGLLFLDDRPLRIVEAPPAFPRDFDYDPLDARDALPPLLCRDVLLDLGTFGRWEREVVAIFARDDLTVEEALGIVASFTETLRAWNPGAADLGAYFEEALENTRLESRSTQVPATFDVTQDFSPVHHYRLVLGAIPDALRPVVALDGLEDACAAWVEPSWTAFAGPVRRYLAAKSFGSWLAYQGYGLRTIVLSLAVALSTLKVNAAIECAKRASPLDRETLTAAIRRTDEMLLHLASREQLARALSGIEARPGARVDATLSPDVR